MIVFVLYNEIGCFLLKNDRLVERLVLKMDHFCSFHELNPSHDTECFPLLIFFTTFTLATLILLCSGTALDLAV